MTPDTETSWTQRLQERVRAIEFYSPEDAGSPAQGWYACVGPTSEMTMSDQNMEHAALLYLATVVKDHDARVALGLSTTNRPPAK